MTIEAFYSCPDCGLQRVRCEVPTRVEEDVIAWMNAALVHIGADHGRRSPGCHPKEFTDVMIPMTGANKIGGPAVQ